MANDYIMENLIAYEITESEKEKLLDTGIIVASEDTPGQYDLTAFVWDDLGVEGYRAYRLLDLLLDRPERKEGR